jgi:hypothetical protein
MSEELYERICQELSDNGFDGCAQLFLLNEPTMDKTLLGKAARMRTAIPRGTIYISTNVDTINRKSRHINEKLNALTDIFDSGINVVNLNIYDPGPEQHNEIWEIANEGVKLGLWEMTEHKYRKHRPAGRFICVTDMRPERITHSITDMFYDRTAEDRVHVKADQVHCARPHRHLVVRWDGIVPLCCALDPTDPNIIVAGDLNTQTITEVWNSETMFKYRYMLQQKRRVLPGCDTCNHRMSYSHVVRHVTAPPEYIDAWERQVPVE